MIARFSSPFLFCLCLIATCPAQVDEEALDEAFVAAEEALRRGRDERALECLEPVLKADPNDPEALALAIKAAWNLGRVEDLEDLVNRYRASDPKDPARIQIAAELLARRGKIDEALELLAPLLQEVETSASVPRWNFPAHALAASWHESRGRDEEARKHLQRLVDDAKRVVIRAPRDLVALAQAYVHFGGPREAEKVLVLAQKAVEDEDPTPSVALGRLYLDHLRVQGDAVLEFERALKIRPNYAPALHGLIRAFEEWQKSDRAEGPRRTLRLLDRRHPGVALEDAKRALTNIAFGAAEEALGRIFEIDPTDREGLALSAGLVWLREGRAAGEAATEGFLRVDPTFGRGLTLIAEVLNQRRRWPEALDLCRRATAIDPKDPELWDHRARYAFFLGLDREGMDALRKADRSDAFSHVWRRNMFEVRRVLASYYEEARTERFLHRFHRRERQGFAPMAVPFAEKSYEILVGKYGYVPEGVPAEDHEGKILVEWFRDVNGFSARTLGFTNFGALGVCFGPFIGMNSPGSRQPGEFSWARTFHHELAHTLTVGLSRGRTTRWLTEGLSTYEEMAFDPAWDRGLYRELFDAVESGTLFSISDFDGGFGTPRVIFAYFQAGLVARHLVHKHGMEKVVELLRAYGSDLSTAEAWPKVFGQSTQAFDKEFEAAVREILAGTKILPRRPPEWLKVVEGRVASGAPEPGDLVELALSAAQRGRGLDALSFISRARSEADDDPRLLIAEGLVALSGNKVEAARSHFEQFLRQGGENFEVRVQLAQMADARGDRALAEEHLKFALAAFPRVALGEDPRLKLIAFAEEAQDSERAAKLREEYLARNFEALPVRAALIAHYEKTGDEKALKRHLEAWVYIDPLNLEMITDLAPLRRKAGELAAAAAAYECAIGLLLAAEAPDPALVERARLARAETLLEIGPTAQKEAREELLRILQNNPEQSEAKALLERLQPATEPAGGKSK